MADKRLTYVLTARADARRDSDATLVTRADYGDLVAAQRRIPADVVTVSAQPRWITKLRSWRGR